jgi:hypothetical protein
MITKAGKQGIRTFVNWTGQNTTPNIKAMFPNEPIYNNQHQQRWICTIASTFVTHLNIQYNYNPGFIFGSGNTAPTEDDYFLERQITSGLSVVLTGTSRGVDSNGKLYMEFLFTVTNTSSANVTIAEMGLISQWSCCTSASATTAGNNNILVDRTVLDTPVTIEPNDSAAIRYRITSDISFS